MVLPASEGSILAYLAAYPRQARERREVLDRLSQEAREVAQAILDPDAEVTTEAKETAAAIRLWAGQAKDGRAAFRAE